MSESTISKETNIMRFEHFTLLLRLYKYSINKKIKTYYVSHL